MRRPFFAANWKMHSPPQGWDADDSPYLPLDDRDVVIFPSFLDIPLCLDHFLTVGAQYGRSEESGAFTGEISMRMIAQHGCRYVLCGHSERRQRYAESDDFIGAQTEAAIASGLTPVLCIGETADDRADDATRTVLERQLSAFRSGCILAYEPVWAIGTGSAALPEEVQETHAFLRSLLPSSAAQQETRILYGGSVHAENVAAFLAQPDIDGVLVGSASLDPNVFRRIVHIPL